MRLFICLSLITAGFSFGGTLCFEVASQLNEQDEDVATVILLDTYQWFPSPAIHSKQHLVNYQERLIDDFQQMVVMLIIKLFFGVVFFLLVTITIIASRFPYDDWQAAAHFCLLVALKSVLENI